MALSEYEREMLEALEGQLADEDPNLAQKLAPQTAAPLMWTIVPRNLVFGLMIAVLGLGVTLAGVNAAILPLGFLGVAVVFAGFWYLGSGLRQKPGKAPQAKPQVPTVSFMEKQAQEWLRRMQEGGK